MIFKNAYIGKIAITITLYIYQHFNKTILNLIIFISKIKMLQKKVFIGIF